MRLRFTLGLIGSCLLGNEVIAGAWTLPENRGQFISTASRTVAPVKAWFGGTIDADSNRNQLFLEYGFWDDLTVGMTVFGDVSTTSDDLEAGLGGHVRHRLWAEDGSVFSVQAGFTAPIERWLGNGLGDNRPNSATEVDVRVLYGRGWQSDWGNSFLSSEFGMRVRSEGLDEQLRLDATIGHEPTRGLLLLASMFTSVPLGADDDVSVKFSPSLAYTLWPFLSENEKKPWQPISPDTVQIGVTWDAASPSSGLEIGLSIWRSF